MEPSNQIIYILAVEPVSRVVKGYNDPASPSFPSWKQAQLAKGYTFVNTTADLVCKFGADVSVDVYED